MNEFLHQPVRIQAITAPWLQQQHVLLDVLRLDEWHAVVSGNKWFKLKYYLQDTLSLGCRVVATFGGAYSNHIVATAFACSQLGLQSHGFIRGEAPDILSHTLQQAHAYGMQLHFVSRAAYKNKEAIKLTMPHACWINEGGYGAAGAAGAADILSLVPALQQYTHIACAVGTGTTLAGIVQSAQPHQHIVGISVLKGHQSLEHDVRNLLTEKNKASSFTIHHHYHFGGYAKHTPALLAYMNEVWLQYRLPLDFVYTAKTFYALQQMVLQNKIPAQSRVLMIHTGGLQGNLSLPYGVLAF